MDKEEILLREYESLMNHLLENWRLRYILVSLNITALGTLLSLAITMVADATLLLTIMSLVSSSLGIVWVGETVWATKTMNRVRDKIAPTLSKLQSDVPIIMPIDDPDRTRLTPCKVIRNVFAGKSPGATILLLLFLLPSFVGWLIALVLALLNFEKQHCYSWALVGIAALLLYILIVGGVTWYKEWTKKEEKI